MKDRSLYEMGKTYHTAKNYQTAITYYREAIQLNPLEADYYEAIGNAASFIVKDIIEKRQQVINRGFREDDTNLNLYNGSRGMLYHTVRCMGVFRSYGELKGNSNGQEVTSLVRNYEYALLLDPTRLYLRQTIAEWKQKAIIQPLREGYEIAVYVVSGAIASVKRVNEYDFTFYFICEDYSLAINWLEENPPKEIDIMYVSYGIAYSRLQRYDKAKFYLNAKLSKFNANKDENLFAYCMGFYERGLIHQIEGNSEDAISDFKKAIEIQAKLYEYNPRPLLELKKEELKIKANLEKADKLVTEARTVYSEGNFHKAKELFLDSAKLTKRNELIYLYLILLAIKENNYPAASQHLKSFLELAMPNNAHYKVVEALENKLEEMTLAYVTWMSNLVHQLPNIIVNQAKNEVIKNGVLEPKKEQKLLLTLKEIFRTAFVMTLPFPAENYPLLVDELVKVVKSYFIHKPTSKTGEGALHLHFTIKEDKIATDENLAKEIRAAISTTRSLPISKKPMPIESLKQIQEKINETALALENELNEGVPKRVIKNTSTSQSSSTVLAEEKPVTITPSHSKSESHKKDKSSASKVEKQSSSKEKHSSDSKNTTIEKLRTKREDEQQSELKAALTEIHLARKNHSISKAELFEAYKKWEKTAILLSSTEFFMSRAEFCYEAAEKETHGAPKIALYTKALKDYEKVMSYNPLIEGVSEKMDAIALKLDSNNNVSKNPVTLFAAPTTAPLSRADLTPEQIKELEELKAQMKKENSI